MDPIIAIFLAALLIGGVWLLVRRSRRRRSRPGDAADTATMMGAGYIIGGGLHNGGSDHGGGYGGGADAGGGFDGGGSF